MALTGVAVSRDQDVDKVRASFRWLAAKPSRAPRYPSPLRYPGAKRKLVAHIRELLVTNQIRPALFVEPFAGGASVSVSLLWEDRVQSIGLIDSDPLVSAFWKCVFWDTQWLTEQVKSVPLTVDTWKKMRAANPRDTRGRALKCLYLNRTSFSGILNRRAGPIGGMSQEGTYKIGCRFDRLNLADRLREAGTLRDRVAFVRGTDWQLALQWVEAQQASGNLPKAFYYFDPPFFDKAFRLYSRYFDEEDHLRLRDALNGLDASWILSYDRLDRVQELYGDLAGGAWSVGGDYTAAAGAERRSTEAMLTNLPIRPFK